MRTAQQPAVPAQFAQNQYPSNPSNQYGGQNQGYGVQQQQQYQQQQMYAQQPQPQQYQQPQQLPQQPQQLPQHIGPSLSGPSAGQGMMAPGGGFQGQYGGPGSLQMNNRAQQYAVARQEWPAFNSPDECMGVCFGSLPANKTIRKKIPIPIYVSTHPLGGVTQEDGTVNCPISSVPPNTTIIRCVQCRVYMNPFVTWEDHGGTWVCNHCDKKNELQHRGREYFAGPLDECYRRTDRYNHPELHSGTMEFLAPVEYTMRPPMRPVFVFCIDVSRSAVNKGTIRKSCEAIIYTIRNIPTDEGGLFNRARIMVATFDSDTHLYTFPTMAADGVWTKSTAFTVPGSSSPFMAAVAENQLIVDIQDNKERIIRLLDEIPNIWSTNGEARSCLGQCMKILHLYLTNTGGNVMCFLASKPSVGDVSTAIDQGSQRMGAKTEASLKPCNNKWQKLANDISVDKENHCPSSVTYFTFLNTDVQGQDTLGLDLPTIGPLALNSGREIYHYDCYPETELQLARLSADVLQAVTNTKAWESCVRVRISRGWQVSQWHLPMEVKDCLVSLPNFTSEKLINFCIDLDETNDVPFTGTHVHIQLALLYSTPCGSRRIRVHNKAIPIAINGPLEIWGSVNPTLIFKYLTHLAVNQAKTSRTGAGADALHNMLEILNTGMRQAQYEYSEDVLKNLAQMCHGLLRSDAFRDLNLYRDLTWDKRYATWSLLQNNMALNKLVTFCKPELYSLHNLAENDDCFKDEVYPCRQSIDDKSGVYLLDNGYEFLLWKSPQLPSDWFHTKRSVWNRIAAAAASGGRDVFLSSPGSIHEMRFFNRLVFDQGLSGEDSFEKYMQGISSNFNRLY